MTTSKWIDTIQQHLSALKFNIKERSDGSVSMLIVKNKTFTIRIFERQGDALCYTADIAVTRNFDRWANSTDWFVTSREPFSVFALMDVINRFYKRKYYDKDCSDYLDITSNVMSVQSMLEEVHCPTCKMKKEIVVMNKKDDCYECPVCKDVVQVSELQGKGKLVL
jgi:hypothetical protein